MMSLSAISTKTDLGKLRFSVKRTTLKKQTVTVLGDDRAWPEPFPIQEACLVAVRPGPLTVFQSSVSRFAS